MRLDAYDTTRRLLRIVACCYKLGAFVSDKCGSVSPACAVDSRYPSCLCERCMLGSKTSNQQAWPSFAIDGTIFPRERCAYRGHSQHAYTHEHHMNASLSPTAPPPRPRSLQNKTPYIAAGARGQEDGATAMVCVRHNPPLRPPPRPFPLLA